MNEEYFRNFEAEIVNLTPHNINIVDENGEERYSIEASGVVARCCAKRNIIGTINDIPVNIVSYGKVTDLPDPVDGVIYIVSLTVAKACPDRTDLYVVDDTVHDDTGRIIGARALARI